MGVGGGGPKLPPNSTAMSCIGSSPQWYQWEGEGGENLLSFLHTSFHIEAKQYVLKSIKWINLAPFLNHFF